MNPSAHSLSHSFCDQGAVNYVVHYEPNRDRMGCLKKNALTGLKKLSERLPIWIDNTEENRKILMQQREVFRIKKLSCQELKVCFVAI